MRVAVLGTGPGGCAMAFEWGQAGHEVTLFATDDYPGAVADVAAAGGITAKGEMSGFVPVSYAGHDIAKALDGAELIFAVGPAYSTEPFAKASQPHAKPGQVYVVCPSSGAGAIVFKRTLGYELDDDAVTVAETSTLPYAVRLTGPAEITVFNRLGGGYAVAALPTKATPEVTKLLASVHSGIEAAPSVWSTSLQNGNPVIHPAVTLMNAALIERTGGDFLFYEEGVTQSVGRLIAALDAERIALGKALGIKVLRDPQIGIAQGYQEVDSYDIGYSTAPGFKGIKAQSQLDHRYLNEDAGYGLVLLTDLGRQIGVPTPTMDAVLQVASVVMDQDYAGRAARTMSTLGLDGLDPAELRKAVGDALE